MVVFGPQTTNFRVHQLWKLLSPSRRLSIKQPDWDRDMSKHFEPIKSSDK